MIVKERKSQRFAASLLTREDYETKNLEQEHITEAIESVLERRLGHPPSRRYADIELLALEISRALRGLYDVQIVVSDINDRVRRLEQHEKRESERRLREKSRDNVRKLRQLFGLPEIEGEVKEDVIAKMTGLLTEYAAEGMDSVELLRSVRDDS